ncbi:hypothetical protein GDO81_003104 [Engystomops pustulosus]|uniref:Uncharacterized protein n=1 Tax=Engystomops pustulosus TaxID=76066 RepID=A0AAV6ZU89_ENGPU|nr:hypothetical protein GDO81_003104 [Engystomops pustulosus]
MGHHMRSESIGRLQPEVLQRMTVIEVLFGVWNSGYPSSPGPPSPLLQVELDPLSGLKDVESFVIEGPYLASVPVPLHPGTLGRPISHKALGLLF